VSLDRREFLKGVGVVGVACFVDVSVLFPKEIPTETNEFKSPYKSAEYTIIEEPGIKMVVVQSKNITLLDSVATKEACRIAFYSKNPDTFTSEQDMLDNCLAFVDTRGGVGIPSHASNLNIFLTKEFYFIKQEI